MMHIYDVLNSYWKEIALAITVVTIAKIAYEVWLGTRFITKVLSDPPIGFFNAAYKYAKVFVLVPSLLVSFGGRRLNAARYIVELEILKPAESRPNPHDYDVSEFAAIMSGWEAGEAQRKKEVEHLLKEHFAEDEPEFWGWFFKSLKSSLFGRPKPEPLTALSTVVPIDDFPSLDDSRPAIKRYFEALRAMKEDDRSFLCTAQIEVGYLAPLFLITGLINRFGDEDGWKLILQNYRRLVESDTQYSVELRELRSFLFNCWLLWGPSVSPCSCKAWTAPTFPESLTLQYGYGDENNSIDVIIKNGRGFNFKKILKDRLNTLPDRLDASKFTPVSVYAAPYSVKGRFKWGPHVPEGEVSPAQKLIQGGTLGRRKSLSGRIVLECDEESVKLSDTDRSAKYYSAYIWIMFVITDKDGNLFFPDQPWKNLLPFFEHGNIADATTFLTLKESLMAKVASAFAEILKRPVKPGEAEVSLRYVSALDDSRCPDHGSVMFGSHSGIPGQGANAAPKPERLIDILRSVSSEDTANHTPVLVEAVKTGRLQLPAGEETPKSNDFASCDLPDIVEGFYQDLKSPKLDRAQAPTA